VINAPFLPAAVLARQLASLDVLSGGRLDAGLGLGWAQEEFDVVGFPRARRAARLEDAVGALRALFAPDPVEFHGEFTDVAPSRFLPKPVQRPLPILLGGTAEPALRRAGRIADGWISSSRFDLAQIGTAVATVRAAAEEAGRDAASLRFVVRGVVRLAQEAPGAGERRMLTGPADAVREDLALLREQGVTEVFLDLNFVPRVGSPDADPADALAHADQVLETFAPGR
jgi:alkanesulfonate monooxygenase SsuD/methylene tetrahydromethanopterin reductase-like flavin-dependent oxidoreductase (luciferase family)